MLSLSTIVPDTFNGLTKGLLGNYDGDSSNDFQMPNGTILSANITERKVFEYGKQWEINNNASAFFYPDGKSHEDYHNKTYIPKFLDEADNARVKDAEKVCGGSQNLECIFDYVFTELKEVGEMTNAIKGFVAKNKQNRSSTAVNPHILLCTGCNGRGHCSGTPRGNASGNGQFQKYTCVCDTGYEDINECDEALHNCTHKCNNFDGGFNCSCPQGYNLNQAAWTCIKSG
ncbi:mucin-like protein [Mya arenaria]|uniref:mucin-like protein n=1 Tax=Mya arenaria TaxID=6604 RepID=UPI0022E36694|nr:mucin-like protein [Mya arenaria]